MKRIIILILAIASVFALVGCTTSQNNTAQVTERVSYENGTYRGTFSDSAEMQVGVQFKLEDNKVTEIKFRHLAYKDVNYLKEETDKTIIGLTEQYGKLLEHLEGKDIRDNLKDLYEPGNLAIENVDAFSGATVRSGKVISAIRDGLNRGVYSY